MFRVVHGRFCVISRSVWSDFNNTRSFRVALCSGVEPNRETMLYSLAGLCEIGFIARGYRFSLRRYTSDESFFCSCARSPHERRTISNRGTRKCQSRQRHVRLQRVPLVGAADKSGRARRAMETASKNCNNGKGKGRVERGGGKLFRNCPFLDWNAGTPPSPPPPLFVS